MQETNDQNKDSDVNDENVPGKNDEALNTLNRVDTNEQSALYTFMKMLILGMIFVHRKSRLGCS